MREGNTEEWDMGFKFQTMKFHFGVLSFETLHLDSQKYNTIYFFTLKRKKK